MNYTNTLANSIYTEVFYNTSSVAIPTLNLPFDKVSYENRKAIELIRSFAHLKNNWDTYGANPPSPQAVEKAKYFVLWLSEYNLDVFFTCPSPDGDIVVELKNGDANLEFEFSENYIDTVSASFTGRIMAEEELNKTTRNSYIKWLICPNGNCPPDL